MPRLCAHICGTSGLIHCSLGARCVCIFCVLSFKLKKEIYEDEGVFRVSVLGFRLEVPVGREGESLSASSFCAACTTRFVRGEFLSTVDPDAVDVYIFMHVCMYPSTYERR
jgi:hypothetical protein